MTTNKKTRAFEVGASQKLHQLWERNWARDNFAPSWVISEIPKEVQDAVASEWFAPGTSLLDIGCGSGELAAWLAERGFNVLGVDFSESAIEKARASAGRAQKPNQLLFKVADISALN